MGDVMKVLDHGSISLVESWGSDERIIESARMSTGKGFKGWGDDPGSRLQAPVEERKPGDEKLLRYLWEHKHTTPFEMVGATLEVKAPIFVFREWHRHRTQSYSEMSSRYVPLPSEDYMPTLERVMQVGTGTCQASTAPGALALTEANAARWISILGEHYKDAQALYELSLHIGIPKELARLCLPVARYSAMRASANLLNWTRFLALRLPDNAQWEIRVYAGAAAELLSERFPRTMALFGETLLREQSGSLAGGQA